MAQGICGKVYFFQCCGLYGSSFGLYGGGVLSFVTGGWIGTYMSRLSAPIALREERTKRPMDIRHYP